MSRPNRCPWPEWTALSHLFIHNSMPLTQFRDGFIESALMTQQYVSTHINSSIFPFVLTYNTRQNFISSLWKFNIVSNIPLFIHSPTQKHSWKAPEETAYSLKFLFAALCTFNLHYNSDPARVFITWGRKSHPSSLRSLDILPRLSHARFWLQVPVVKWSPSLICRLQSAIQHSSKSQMYPKFPKTL